MKKTFYHLLSWTFLITLLGLAAAPLTVQAVAGDIAGEMAQQLQPIGTVYGGGTGTISETTFAEEIAKIITVALGFLGLLFLILVIYAGFLWMTAAGNDEKIATAKKIMIAAVIGAAIVLSAYAITIFVISNLLKASGVSSTGIP